MGWNRGDGARIEIGKEQEMKLDRIGTVQAREESAGGLSGLPSHRPPGIECGQRSGRPSGRPTPAAP